MYTINVSFISVKRVAKYTTLWYMYVLMYVLYMYVCIMY